MLTMDAPENGWQVANAIAQKLPESASEAARELYRVLVTIAIEATRRRGQSAKTTEAVFHVPVELVAAAAQMSRVTVWRHLPELRELGLVDNRAHKAACRGETRNSGSLWRVRMSPVKGSRARLSTDDMRHKWRDLDSDVRAGRTSQRTVKLTKDLREQSLKLEMAIQWAINPGSNSIPGKPVSFTNPRRALEAVLDVTGTERDRRGVAVDMAAQAVATALRDRGGTNYYRLLLWQLLRRYDATGEDYSYQVYLAAQRAAVDAGEWRELRRPGALLVSRLRGAAWFAEMMAAPPVRVGTRPLAA